MRFKLIGLSLLLLATAVFVLTSLSSNAVAQEGSTAKAGSATKAEPAAKEGSAAKEAPTAEPMEFTLAEDQLAFVAPGKWQRVQPRSRILEAELKVPSTEADVQDGRITMMRAGGSIPENVARWEGQFAGSEGAETEKEEIAGKTVHFVNITGTFQDSMGRGPFAGGKKVSRENYQMRAAIVETGDHGNYFFKFIGPKSIVEPNGDAFSAMIRSMKLK